MAKFLVIENRNVGTIGNPEMLETVIFAGQEKECLDYAEQKRSPLSADDRVMLDYFVESEEKYNKILEKKTFYNSLTDEQKNDIIEVDGKRYVRAIYERNLVNK